MENMRINGINYWIIMQFSHYHRDLLLDKWEKWEMP
jgi:hypothetical protein